MLWLVHYILHGVREIKTENLFRSQVAFLLTIEIFLLTIEIFLVFVSSIIIVLGIRSRTIVAAIL